MKRTQIYLTNDLYARLKIHAQNAGVTVSEVIRQAAEEFLRKKHRGINLKALKKYAGFVKLNEPTNAVQVIRDYYKNDVIKH